MKLRYEQLSEKSGIIVDELDRTYIFIHEGDNRVTVRPINVGERPTFLNKEAANRWMNNGLEITHPDNIRTKEKPAAFRYLDKAAELLTPEYQLYLAKQLESKTKASKPTFAETQELTGYLPHEESPQ